MPAPRSLLVIFLATLFVAGTSNAQRRFQRQNPQQNQPRKNPGDNRQEKLIDEKITVKLEPVWKLYQVKDVSISMRGLHVLDDDVIWASGAEGTVLRSMNGGESWKVYRIPGAEKLDFRDIHAFDEGTAVIISAGTPARIYHTTDGGASWNIAFEHPRKEAFFDALSFWDDNHGIVMSDPVENRVVLVVTKDGGRTWSEIKATSRPTTFPGEAGFAASGTNMAILPSGRLLIALGGAEKGKRRRSSRILITDDRGVAWKASAMPLIRGESEGVFSIAFVDDQYGVAVGGDYKRPDNVDSNFAVTENGGATWTRPPKGTPPTGYRSGVAVWRNGREICYVAVGTNGTDLSTDLGITWRRVSNEGFHAIQFSPSGKSGWAVGGDGRIGKWIK